MKRMAPDGVRGAVEAAVLAEVEKLGQGGTVTSGAPKVLTGEAATASHFLKRPVH
jgi:hypothetical protein